MKWENSNICRKTQSDKEIILEYGCPSHNFDGAESNDGDIAIVACVQFKNSKFPRDFDSSSNAQMPFAPKLIFPKSPSPVIAKIPSTVATELVSCCVMLCST